MQHLFCVISYIHKFCFFIMASTTAPRIFVSIAIGFPAFANCNEISDRAFRAIFGATAAVVAHLWDNCINLIPRNSQKKHLLWSLVFLKVYSTEEVHCGIVGTNPKTFRKWCWMYVQTIASLNLVSLKDYFYFLFFL